MTDLETFIIAAKTATHVGGGAKSAPSGPGAHDLTFAQGDWFYRDSYFGGTDFNGQEVVWHMGNPLWAMNYYGYILLAELIDGTRAGATIKAALTAMYAENRFLGGFDWTGPHGHYTDRSTGDVIHFSGIETITTAGQIAYRLEYCGGLIKT